MAGAVGAVLVGTDFSDTSALALTEARRLAELLGTELRLIHVVDGGAGVGWGETGEARAWFGRTGFEAQQMIVRFGSPWVELTRYVAEVSPTLVVVGSHGRSGYQPLTIGGTASRVTLQSRVPVVLVSPRSVGSEAGQYQAGPVRAGANPAGAGRIREPLGGKPR